MLPWIFAVLAFINAGLFYWGCQREKSLKPLAGVDHNSGHPSNRPRHLTRNRLITQALHRLILQLTTTLGFGRIYDQGPLATPVPEGSFEMRLLGEPQDKPQGSNGGPALPRKT
jgi:hypothetical protein